MKKRKQMIVLKQRSHVAELVLYGIAGVVAIACFATGNAAIGAALATGIVSRLSKGISLISTDEKEEK
jgi:hypothetical protein